MYYIHTEENVAAKYLFLAKNQSCLLETLDPGLGDPEQCCIYHNMTVDGDINVKFKLKACMWDYGSAQFIILFQQNEAQPSSV